MTKICGKIGFVLHAALLLAGCIAAGTVLIILVYMLPVGEMKENVARSSEIYNYERTYPQWSNGYKYTQLDNCSDAYMMIIAIHPGTGSAVRDAMINPMTEYDDKTPEMSLTHQANDQEGAVHESSYARYWHGYLLALKPLLMIFDVSDLRIFNMILQFLLDLYLLRLFYEKLGRRYAIAFAGMLLLLDPVALPMSFQFSTVYYVMALGLLILLKKGEELDRKGKIPFLFMLLGAATSYIDFLTYPVASLGVPLILYLVLEKKSRTLLQKTGKTIGYSVMWSIGYLGMWTGKWIVATFLTGENVVGEALSEILLQTAGEDELFGVRVNAVNSILKNVGVLCKWPFLIAGLLAVIAAVAVILKQKNRGDPGIRRRKRYCRSLLLRFTPLYGMPPQKCIPSAAIGLPTERCPSRFSQY